MNQSPEGELESIAQAASGLQFLLIHSKNKAAMKAIVEDLANRKNSPLANAVGSALKSEMTKYNMI
jgi:hypothetical protein